MAAKYFPQYCSYKTPKRLPKKRNRPTTSAFRAAAAHLDFINSLSGDFNIPDIVNLLSESEDDLIEINNLSEGLERLQDTKKTSTFLSERDNIAKNEEGSEAFAGKNSKGELWRRIVWDYDDEAEGSVNGIDHLTTLA
ncbi:hypothetical protein DDE82_004341 [Stemphylium lycopersici]|nr:hypothetical protein TW65_06454 [Stemphylium lycopersici]RAR04862.1 hypothetical protein DDE82_004341 [Stemphylium lycopersici]